MTLTYSGGDLVDFYSSRSSTTNLTAVLEDSGNFILKDANSHSDQILWQSFDHPTDVFLPGMKLGINRRTGQSWYLASWLSNVVPASGAFTFEWEPNGQQLNSDRRWLWILAAVGTVLIMVLAGILMYLGRRRLRDESRRELLD